jgi:CRISPR/Cas system-associated protein Csm6
MDSRKLPKIVVRLPPDVKAWLAEQALKNASSQTSEIVRAVREKMDRLGETRRNSNDFEQAERK